ncbi:MAG TPA: hypothetical protein VFG95_09920 [Nitrospiria bacterium]|nr:hypothetical protein [Nitrospiria bacterium]
MDLLEQLRGKEVLVHCQGILYRGILVGTSETEIYLQTTVEWITLPMDEVTDVRAA